MHVNFYSLFNRIFLGIRENLALMKTLYPGFVMRLYYQVGKKDNTSVAFTNFDIEQLKLFLVCILLYVIFDYCISLSSKFLFIAYALQILKFCKYSNFNLHRIPQPWRGFAPSIMINNV